MVKCGNLAKPRCILYTLQYRIIPGCALFVYNPNPYLHLNFKSSNIIYIKTVSLSVIISDYLNFKAKIKHIAFYLIAHCNLGKKHNSKNIFQGFYYKLDATCGLRCFI